MARTAGRSAEETRRLILDAAQRLLARSGTAVPVSEVAEAAGVSKGGLLYHFPSKEVLLRELATDVMQQFRRTVEERAAEEEEGVPGRLCRAYVRVCFSDAADVELLRDHLALAAHLMVDPALDAIAREDAARWREELHADGLDASVVRLVIAAADGSTSGPLWGAVLTPGDNALLEEDLLALTRRHPG